MDGTDLTRGSRTAIATSGGAEPPARPDQTPMAARLRPLLSVFEYYLVAYRRTWRGSVLSSFVLPLLTLLGFGIGVGGYVESGVAGVPYLDYLVPGLIASTALQVAMGESSWPVLSNFEWTKIYLAQRAAPLRITDILGGHLAFVSLRVLTSGAAFLLVAALFGVLHSVRALAIAPLVVLIGLAVAAPCFAYSSTISTDSYLAVLYRFVVIPMTLFAGVFFPVDSLPALLRVLAYVSPLWHGVELCRATTLGTAPAWPITLHLLYLLGWAGAGWLLARARFRHRLVD